MTEKIQAAVASLFAAVAVVGSLVTGLLVLFDGVPSRCFWISQTSAVMCIAGTALLFVGGVLQRLWMYTLSLVVNGLAILGLIAFFGINVLGGGL